MQITRDIPQNLLPCSSEYKQTANPYYIVAPDYTHKSAGIRLLHQLCSALNQMGYEGYVVSNKTNGELWTPRLTEETKVAHYLAGKKPIVVYPEVIKGRPLGLGLPVRYILNYPGLLGGGDKRYTEEETVFTFNEEYFSEGIILYLPIVNIEQINNTETRELRSHGMSAVYYNRYRPTDEELSQLGLDCIDISSSSGKDFREVLSILKSVEVLYSFENSAIIAEAWLCGCAVVLLKSEIMKEVPERMLKNGMDGYAWGRDPNEIHRAISTVKLAKKKWIEDFNGWVGQLKNFINITQEKASNLKIQTAWPQKITDELSIPDLSVKEIAAKSDRKKYNRVNEQYKVWQTKSTLREIDADIYAEYIAKGGLPSIGVLINHDKMIGNDMIADTLDSIDSSFLKTAFVLIVSNSAPPKGFEQSAELSWLNKSQLIDRLEYLDSTDWILILEAGVRLAPNALVEFAISAKAHPETLLFYADEDICNKDGNYTLPNFKPEFNIELIRCSNYVGGSVLFNKSRWLESGRPAAVHEVYQFLLTCSLSQDAKLIRRVDGMLIHGMGQISSATENLEFEVAQSTLLSSGFVKAVKPMDRLGSWLLDYTPVVTQNTTLVVPTGVQPGYMRQMLESLIKHACPNLAKIILVCNENDFDEVGFALKNIECVIPFEVVTYVATQYNHSHALNKAILNVTTEYVWVCDDDIEFIHDDTLGVMLSIAQQADVGCVEPRLMSTHGPDARLVAGPMVLGIQGASAAYTGEMQLPEEYGYFSKLQLTQDVSTVSGHCFVFRASQWKVLGGFDENKFGLKYSVLDFCLKLNRLGYRHVWAPLANAMHQGGRSIQKRLGDFEYKVTYAQNEVKERSKLLELWGEDLANDRFYNRHLSLLTPYDVESDIVIDWKPNRKDRPRVLASPLTSGAGQYRVIEPLEMLQDQSLVQSSIIMPMANRQTRVLQPIELVRAQPDTLVLQHSVDDAQLPLIEQYKKALPNIHILQMVDDLMGFVPDKHPSRRFQSREGHTRMIEAIKRSDSMIVTTEPLKNHYEKYIKNVKTIPNCLAKHWFNLAPVKNKQNRLRVGWIGAGQHQGDLEIINEVVKVLSDRVDWVFMGMHTEQAKPYIKEFHSFVSIKDYPKKMASLDLDIAVAPLEDNLFNQCKSNLRLLEYGAMSWPVVCADVLTYQTNNPPVIRVKPTVADWLAALNRLIDDESERLRLGRELHTWVINNYTLENWAPEWSAALFKHKT
jgi:GT2 family glycosyltransferase